jgi:hypothetical protein
MEQRFEDRVVIVLRDLAHSTHAFDSEGEIGDFLEHRAIPFENQF